MKGSPPTAKDVFKRLKISHCFSAVSLHYQEGANTGASWLHWSCVLRAGNTLQVAFNTPNSDPPSLATGHAGYLIHPRDGVANEITQHPHCPELDGARCQNPTCLYWFGLLLYFHEFEMFWFELHVYQFHAASPYTSASLLGTAWSRWPLTLWPHKIIFSFGMFLSDFGQLMSLLWSSDNNAR